MSQLRSYLDSGLLARRSATRSSPFVPVSLVILASTVAFGAMFIADVGWLFIVAIVWAGLMAGTDPDSSSLGWLLVPLTRAVEYGLVVVLAHDAGVPGPVLFAYLAAVAYHHYDQVHRFSILSSGPKWWLGAILGGSGVRSSAAAGAAALGVLPVWLVVAGVWIAVVGVAESATTWSRVSDQPTGPSKESIV